MLRRNSSKRPSRSKSTSSAQSKHESIDPEMARLHAQTAATLAFARALERSSADGANRGGISRSNSTAQDVHRPSLVRQGSTASNMDGVKRQQSVRFVGPHAVQRRQSVGRSTHVLQIKESTATLRPMARTTNTPVPAIYRPPSRSSSLGKASYNRARAESFTTANAFDEYYTREDDVASTPSSYRRIRKSKSLFSPLKAQSVFYSNGSPERPESSHFRRQNSLSRTDSLHSKPSRAALRGPKSMGFLRSRGRDQSSQDRNDTAVQMARDRFFQETAQQRLREQPSFLFRSKAQRQEKPFRKSVRSSSGTQLGDSIASPDQDQRPRESSIRDVARKASESLKKKFKRVFRRAKDEPIAIPDQQVEAPETYAREYNGNLNVSHENFSDIPMPDEACLSRVASRVPSIHQANSSQQLRSHAGSLRSVGSFRSDLSDDKSRVTSWNSTGVNTVTSQGARNQAEKGQQRLSVINEHGSHIPSSSFSRPRLSNQISAYPLHHRISKSVGHIPGPGQVDSARVYSALMKHVDGNTSPRSKAQLSREMASEGGPARSNSVGSSRNRPAPATIRHVPPTDYGNSSQDGGSVRHNHQWVRIDSIHSARAESMFGTTGEHVHQWTAADPLREARMRSADGADDVFAIKGYPNNKESIPVHQPQRFRSESNVSASIHSYNPSTRNSYHTVPETIDLTPQEIAAKNEESMPTPKVLQEQRSTFFGGTSHFTTRSTSPFRRAMAESEGNATVIMSGTPPLFVTVTPPIRNPLFIGAELPNTQHVHGGDCHVSERAYTESIYSRTTSGQTPGPATSALSLAISEEKVPDVPRGHDNGEAVIIDRAVYRPSMPTAHKASSSAGSAEWKRWMSSEVAKLERAKENKPVSSYVNYALPTIPKSYQVYHVRENGQINDDDSEISQRRVSGVKQPLGMIMQQNPNIQNIPGLTLKPILKKPSAVSLKANIESFNTSPTSIPVPPPPPPIPPRSPLRHKMSKTSLRSTPSTPGSVFRNSSMNNRNVLHKRNVSQTTLRSVRSTKSASLKSQDSPAKLVKRNGRPSYGVATPSPGSGLAAVVEMQFGSTKSMSFASDSGQSRYRTPGVMPLVRGDGCFRGEEGEEDVYGVEGAGLLGEGLGRGRGGGRGGERMSMPEAQAQALGSKAMVDMFLSSRRRRIASLPGSGTGENGEGGGGVFL